MEIYKDTQPSNDKSNSLLSNIKLSNGLLRSLKGESANHLLNAKSEEYLRNVSSQLERVKKAYEDFSGHFNRICENYMWEVNAIGKDEMDEVKELKSTYNKIINELMVRNEELKKRYLHNEKEPSFVYKGNSKSKMDAELVKKYPGSYAYREYMFGKRTADGNVLIECDSENDELIVKYMKGDSSLIDDVRKMNNEKKSKLIDDLSFFELPIKKELIKQMGCNEDNKIMEAWRERRVVMVNGKNASNFNKILKKRQLFNPLFDNEYLKDIHYYKQSHIFYINLSMKYIDVIEDYLKNGKKANKDLVKKYYRNGNYNELSNEMKMLGITLNEREKNEIIGCFDLRFLRGSLILLDTQYDNYLRKWLGYNYDMKLLYRASEHGYTAKSFHECCDNKGPTLIVIKSSGGWIFGGYTTRSWSGYCIYLCI